MAEDTEQVTEEQANAALQQLVHDDESEFVESAETEQAAAEQPEISEEAQESAEVEAGDSGEQPEEAGQDDVDSLNSRLAEREKELESNYQSRIEAMKARYAENDRIGRERYLRKSTAADRALKALQRAKSEEGADVAEIDSAIRELEETMNPSSAKYSPSPEISGTVEDQALVLNNFLNEQALTQEEAGEFGKWLQFEATSSLSPPEQAVANRDLEGFLRIAYPRFLDGKREAEKKKEQTDAVNAVNSVKRTQREAARAATAKTTSPKKNPAGPKTPQPKKLSPAEVSALVRQSVEQYG